MTDSHATPATVARSIGCAGTADVREMRCYDFANLRTMILRALAVTAVLGTLASSADGQVQASAWHAVANSPRPAIPSVEVDLGYRADYVPAPNAPIAIHIRNSAAPFDGYIGYHLAVGKNRTRDIAVIARAAVRRGSNWDFSTWLRVDGQVDYERENKGDILSKRELVIEWRNRDMALIAQTSVGVPPWSRALPLRIIRGGETAAATTYSGETAVSFPASSLSSRPQWYRGFSSVVTPTDAWFELPAAVRDAIFTSGIKVGFFGIPRTIPRMSAVDRALLPVEFHPGAGTIEIPWPYGSTRRGAPLSWSAKPGTTTVGSPACPYLVGDDLATYAADERGIAIGLPAASLTGRFTGKIKRVERPSVGEVLRQYRPMSALVLLFIASIALWIAIARRNRMTAIVFGLAITLIAMQSRDGIRPAVGSHLVERITIVAPGVAYVERAHADYGPAPRPPVPLDRTDAVTLPSPDYSEDAELRTSDTPPGFGTMFALERPWDSTARVSAHQEISAPAAIHLLSIDDSGMTIDYASRIPFRYVTAHWTWKSRRYSGQALLADAHRGRVMISTTTYLSDADHDWRWRWLLPNPWIQPAVEFIGGNDDRTTFLRQFNPPSDAHEAIAAPYSVVGALHPELDGTYSTLFRLPGAVPAGGTATITIEANRGPRAMRALRLAVRRMTVAGPDGLVEPTSDRRDPVRAAAAGAEIERVAAGSRLVKLTVDAPSLAADIRSCTATLSIEEKKK